MFDQQFRTVVSVEDPALDRDAMDLEKYGETRDESLVRLLPGQTPRKYIVRRMTRGEREFVYSRPAAKQCSVMIQLALLRVEESDGTVTKPTKQVPNISGMKQPQTVWDDAPGAELDALADRVDISEWIELAHVIETMAGMKLGEAYGSSTGRFGLLPASQAALARIEQRRAERARP